jgi:hypothetical protein
MTVVDVCSETRVPLRMRCKPEGARPMLRVNVPDKPFARVFPRRLKNMLQFNDYISGPTKY